MRVLFRTERSVPETEVSGLESVLTVVLVSGLGSSSTDVGTDVGADVLGLESAVTVVPVSGLETWSPNVESPSVIKLWTSEAVTCPVVEWVPPASDSRSSVTLMEGLFAV